MWSFSRDSAEQLRSSSELFIASVNANGGDVPTPFFAASSVLLKGITCHTPEGRFEFFNPKTRFLSYCLTLIVGVVFAAVLLGPILYRIYDLSRHEKGKKTVNGQLAVLSSLLAHFAFLSYFFVRSYTPTWAELFIGVTGFLTALLQSIQDGRVFVSSAEVLLYWFGIVFTYLGFALDSYLRHGLKKSILLVAASFFAVVSFSLELNNKDRYNEDEGASLDTANIFSKISIAYANGLLAKGSKGPIERDDLPKAPLGLNTVNCYHGLEEALSKRSTDNKYRLLISLGNFLGAKLWTVFFLDILSESITYISPSVLGLFLHSLELYVKGESPLFVSFYYGILLSLLPLFTVSLGNLVTLSATYTYIMTKTSLTALIYRKAMNLSPAGREKFESSKIMNLITVDAEQVDGLATVLPVLVSAPTGMIISTWQLWKLLGPSMFTSLVLYGILVPFTGLISARFTKLMPIQMKNKDKRNKLTSNVFRSIKSLKLYAWEKPFYQRVADVREKDELVTLRKITVLSAVFNIIFNMMGDVVAIGIFTTYLWLQEGSLDPSVVFPSLLLLQLATSPFMDLPNALVSISRMLTSQNRINELLVEKDQDYVNYNRASECAHGYEEFALKASDATISWNGEDTDQKVALKGISLEATRGDLLCITGRVGSGKTGLLKALCGELSVIGGSIDVKGSLAYCTQDAWLQNLTLRDNILFGQKYNEEWYNQVLEHCELFDDIKQMPKGDQTDVGERGISLSGGQKARVALARAVYARADVYLFDDVLSAVDEHVSARLIEKIFSKDGILGNRTIVLATNNVKVLSNASIIVELADKKVAESASFQEVITRGKDSKIYRLIEEFGHAEDLQQEAEKVEKRKPYIIQKEKDDPDFYPPTHYAKPLEVAPVNIRLSSDDDEEKEKEAVSLSIFKRYFEVLPKWYYVFFLCILILSTIITSSENVYLGYMSEKGLTNLFDARWYLLGYFSIVVLSAAFIILSNLWNSIVMGLRVSKALHNRMLWNVMHAPMAFFDTTPLGRLINRFTGDIATLDSSFPPQLYYTVRSIFNVIVNLVIIVTGSPLTAFVLIPLAFVGNNFRKIYVPSQRKVARMASASNSPILSHIEESLKGQSVLRSFDRTSQFNSVYEERVDYWIQVAFLRMNLNQWLGYRIQSMTSVLMLATTLSVSWLLSKNVINVGYCGVIVHFSSRAGIMLRQTLSLLAQLEVSGVSLERILEYVDVEQEAPPHIEATEPEGSWPSSGVVKFENLSARYKPEGPDVLKDLSFTINGAEKIGIVGRTGSGKSTLTMAIFRILESHAGHINIDDINTSILGLNDLRSKLSIIPQDAQIFDGTLRENLDPLGTADDARLWEVLELCHLKDHFSSAEEGLDAPLSDGGGNLSRGQSQLVCLGRALIHEAKILVLDEATASVDVETDRVVQQTIRQNFKERTIITIAHRINTIMDSDKILVLDYGVVKEFDSPENLLKAKGIFHSLYTASKTDNEENTEKILDETLEEGKN